MEVWRPEQDGRQAGPGKAGRVQPGTFIGPGPSRLCSDWLDLDIAEAYAIKNQLNAPKGPLLTF